MFLIGWISLLTLVTFLDFFQCVVALYFLGTPPDSPTEHGYQKAEVAKNVSPAALHIINQRGHFPMCGRAVFFWN